MKRSEEPKWGEGDQTMKTKSLEKKKTGTVDLLK